MAFALERPTDDVGAPARGGGGRRSSRARGAAGRIRSVGHPNYLPCLTLCQSHSFLYLDSKSMIVPYDSSRIAKSLRWHIIKNLWSVSLTLIDQGKLTDIFSFT